MRYGLKEDTIQKIQKVFTNFQEIEQAILFGSRARGKSKLGSDIDFALKGKDLNLFLLNKISLQLENLNTPYVFDLAIYHQIQNPDLLEHIQRVGIIFYSKEGRTET